MSDRANMYEFGWSSQDGVKIFARGWEPSESGKGVICLVHGIGEHSGRYRALGDRLHQSGYAVLAMDLRGHGRSGGRRGHTPSYELLMDDIKALLEEAGMAYPIAPKILYGQSLGGNLVINYLLRRKPAVRAAIATSPGLRLAFAPPKWQVLLGRIFNLIWPTFTMSRGTDYEGVCRDPAVLAELKADPLHHDVISARLGVELLASGEWALDHASQLNRPLLIMHGGADRMASAAASEEFARRAGKLCTLKMWQGCYHELHNEPEREQVNNFLLNWLEQLQID